MSKLTLRAFLVLSLLGFAGCAAPEQQGPEVEENPDPPGGVPEAGRIELPEPKLMPITGNPNRPVPPPPPPAWLVVGGEAVQASYGRTCEEGTCNGREPQQQASELAIAEVPADEEVLLVIGSDESVELSAGVVGWEEVPDGPTPPSVFKDSEVPYFMRELDARPMPEGERPVVEVASGGKAEQPSGFAVFELASTGNPGDRLLSVYARPPGELARPGRENQTAYHWRLDPGQEGENLPPEEAGLPRVVELERGPETVEYSPEEVDEQAAFREVEKTSFDRSSGIEAGEGYLWILKPGERPQSQGGGPKEEKAEGKIKGKAGPPPPATLLKVDPDTREVLSAIDEPGFGLTLEVGAGAVWLAGNPEKGPEGDKSVIRLNPETEEVQTVEVGGRANQIAATESGVWVAVGASPLNPRVVRLDPETGEVVAEIEMLGITNSVAVDEDTGDVWAESQGRLPFEPGQLVRIDPATNEISGRFEIEGGVGQVVAAGEGAVWATTGAGPESALAKIDPRKELIERVLDSVFLPPGGKGTEVEAGTLWMVSPAGPRSPEISPEGYLPATLTRLGLESGHATVTTLDDFEGLDGYEPTSLAVNEGAVWLTGIGTLTRITP